MITTKRTKIMKKNIFHHRDAEYAEVKQSSELKRFERLEVFEPEVNDA